jgi:hypothetical protein
VGINSIYHVVVQIVGPYASLVGYITNGRRRTSKQRSSVPLDGAAEMAKLIVSVEYRSVRKSRIKCKVARTVPLFRKYRIRQCCYRY